MCHFYFVFIVEMLEGREQQKIYLWPYEDIKNTLAWAPPSPPKKKIHSKGHVIIGYLSAFFTLCLCV